MMRALLLGLIFVLAASQGVAQEDVTRPALDAFTASPVVFDTGTGDVALRWCATLSDDFSGMEFIEFSVRPYDSITPIGTSGASGFQTITFPAGVNQIEECREYVIPLGTAYDTYAIKILISDRVDNRALYWDLSRFPPGELSSDLCAVGPCSVTNRSEMGLPDADGDGTPDDADNCPEDPNSDQADADLDLLGDVCDLCPDYPSTNADFDANGIGDECECGDQTMDGVVNVTDLLAINDVIFGVVPASPLCDANDDGLCNVADILGANAKLFGAAAYCERYPPPAP